MKFAKTHIAKKGKIEGLKFAIFDDRIEITSPGFLSKTLDIEDIKAGRSEIRNKVLARFFKEIRFIEQWGTGIRRIISSCSSAGLKEPEFKETGMFFKVSIYKESNGLVSDGIGLISDSNGLSAEKITTNIMQLSNTELSIIDYLKKNNKITNKLAVELTGLSDAGIRKVFRKLREKKLIKAVGEGRNEMKELLKAYKYRIYPNSEQRLYLAKTFGCIRFIYKAFSKK
ncbi:helix-turn-helix domain protein [Clostridium tepidiprofundi DSM 19306]|uniref:Helix-turn-helix domain protein n=1 Tax=Clostridium tepidiprofundi DSM 19306 TaxID=1121338 RepID=A0A151B2H8_9CLOT|nr:helix-turn-helix domain protein [Clostridium tepidiprofundi DSM 19306]